MCIRVEPTYNPETLAEMKLAWKLEAEEQEKKWEAAQNRRRRVFSILFAGITEQERESFLATVAPTWKEDPDALSHFLYKGDPDCGLLPW